MNYMVIDKVETYFKIMKHFIERLKKYCVATETVFCDNCVHCNNLFCNKNFIYEKNYYKGKKYYERCEIINQNNSCSDFTPKLFFIIYNYFKKSESQN